MTTVVASTATATRLAQTEEHARTNAIPCMIVICRKNTQIETNHARLSPTLILITQLVFEDRSRPVWLDGCLGSDVTLLLDLRDGIVIGCVLAT